MSTITVPSPIPSPTEDSEQLRKAFEGWGTNEKLIIEILGHRTAAQRKAIRQTYTQLYEEDFLKRLESELGHDFERALLLWVLEPGERDALLAHEAIRKWTPKNRSLLEISCARSLAELWTVRQAYHARYKKSFEEDVASHTQGDFRKLLVALVTSYRYEGAEVDIRLAKSEAKQLHEAPYFFNTLYDPYREGNDFVLGYPFSLRKGMPTAISHGLWLNFPDYDAPTQLVKPLEKNKRYVDAVLTIPKGSLFPMSRANLAFNRELIGPAMYFGLMGEGQPISRYDDMWAGWCSKVFLDIVESVNLLMSSKGSVLRCDVTGKILMKCFLSGMPDLKLGLNDKIGLEKESQIKARPTRSGKTIELDDVTFHQCVNLTRFNSEKTVSFVPPDGEFELMKYRITEGVSLPFRVLPTIKELGRTRLEVNVKVKSAFGVKMFAMGVVVKVPVPKQTAKANFQVTTGRAKYNASIDCLVWKIRKFPGQTEATMSAEVELISTMVEKKAWTRPPIQMEFQVIIDAAAYVPPPPSEEKKQRIRKLAGIEDQKRLKMKKAHSQKKATRRNNKYGKPVVAVQCIGVQRNAV